MAKVKSKFILVLMQSLVSRHRYMAIRARTAEQLEEIKFDPYVRQEVLYRESKKVTSLKDRVKTHRGQ